MWSAAKLQLINLPTSSSSSSSHTFTLQTHHLLRLPPRRLASLSLQSPFLSSPPSPPSSLHQLPYQSEPSISSHLTASLGSPPTSPVVPLSTTWNLTHRHILVLNILACAVSFSAAWLFFSAIPALLSFKRAAESLEKLMDATRVELPDTMAAIRLSGMEISDLTMELSDIGQEIAQGVRSSTRAVRVAEERLRQFTNMSSQPPASLQRVVNPKNEAGGPALARNARNIREGIMKGRAILQIFFTLTRFSRMTLNYFAKRAKR